MEIKNRRHKKRKIVVELPPSITLLLWLILSGMAVMISGGIFVLILKLLNVI